MAMVLRHGWPCMEKDEEAPLAAPLQAPAMPVGQSACASLNCMEEDEEAPAMSVEQSDAPACASLDCMEEDEKTPLAGPLQGPAMPVEQPDAPACAKVKDTTRNEEEALEQPALYWAQRCMDCRGATHDNYDCNAKVEAVEKLLVSGWPLGIEAGRLPCNFVQCAECTHIQRPEAFTRASRRRRRSDIRCRTCEFPVCQICRRVSEELVNRLSHHGKLSTRDVFVCPSCLCPRCDDAGTNTMSAAHP